MEWLLLTEYPFKGVILSVYTNTYLAETRTKFANITCDIFFLGGGLLVGSTFRFLPVFDFDTVRDAYGYGNRAFSALPVCFNYKATQLRWTVVQDKFYLIKKPPENLDIIDSEYLIIYLFLRLKLLEVFLIFLEAQLVFAINVRILVNYRFLLKIK